MNSSMKKPPFIEAAKKKWIYPVIYGGAALAIAGLAWGYTAVSGDDAALPVTSLEINENAGETVTIEPTPAAEVMTYPYDEQLLDNIFVVQPFYEVEAPEEERSKSIMVFGKTYSTMAGVTLSQGDEPFEVRAALSGKVTNIISDEFMGDAVVLTHENGFETFYRSVTDITVKVGDEVRQGDPIATSGTNHWNKTAGNHLQFEVKQDGTAVNPAKFIAF